MKILDQGHLQPKLYRMSRLETDMSWLGIEPKVGVEHSRKDPFKQLVNSYIGTSSYERATKEKPNIFVKD
jgi:hypothetical protein